MDTLTKEYLKAKFLEYYSKNDVEEPRLLWEREWAFVEVESLPDFIMRRHIAFDSYIELKGFILKNVPLHIYYSSAYYEKPDAENMEAKGWKKADLIFDIDADHLPNGSLKEAKRQIKMLYDVLEEDFGCKDMEIVFSGSRGYHLHVHDEDFLELSSAERREIVDYLSLTDFKFSRKLPESRQSYRIAEIMAKEIEKALKEGKIRELFPNISERREKMLLAAAEEVVESVKSLNFDYFPKTLEKGLTRLFNKAAESVRIHVDPPVTADVKRLIRLPGSLHGKTGLKVCKVSRDEIDEFKPTRDAVVFEDDFVKIRVKSNVKLRLKEEEFRLKKGKAKVPEFVAIYLICRGVAIYGW